MIDRREMSRAVWLFLGIFAVICFLIVGVTLAFARDNGQWGDTAISEWFASLMQPDNPTISCCGEADAYFADDVRTENGQTIAIITDDRDDMKLGRHHVPIGTKIIVPPNKIKWDRGNPTGHVIIFLSVDNDVYCFVQNGGV